MAIDLQQLQKKLNALLDDQNFIADFEQWLETRKSSQVIDQPSQLVKIFDLLNQAHEQLAKSGLSQDEYSPISWALVDAKKRLSVLLK